MEDTILLNSDYTYLGNISWQKAICLMVKGKVEVIKYTKRIIKNFDGSVVMRIPLVVKLIKIIRTLYKTKVPFSKRNVLIRDGFTCAYCGVKGKNLTIDHVVPRSKGGKSTFENTVTACKKCNNKKDDMLPSEAKMFPNIKATQPTIQEFLNLRIKSLGINKLLKELGVF